MTLLAVILIASVAAVTDIRYRRVPNWLTYPAMLLGVGYHSMVNGGQGFLFGAGGLFLGLALLVGFYLAGGMGAGDVKLMGAVGALLGPKCVFIAFIFTALVGGIYAIALLLLRYRVRGTSFLLGTMFGPLQCGASRIAAPAGTNERTTVLNYGVAIAIGVCLTVLWNVYGR